MLIETSLPYGMITTCFWSLHCWHPLVIITVERQIKKRTWTVRLGTDGQLWKHPPNSLCVTAIACTCDWVLEPFMCLPCMYVRRRATRKAWHGLAIWHCSWISQNVTKVLIQIQKVVRCAIVNFNDLRGHHVIDDKEWWLRVWILRTQRTNVLACITTSSTTIQTSSIHNINELLLLYITNRSNALRWSFLNICKK